MQLFIVESPNKCAKIKSFLGKDFTVAASVGHIREIPKSGVNIDVEAGFKPVFEISQDKKKVVAELKKSASKAEKIWLASDPDREGEAIAAHIYDVFPAKDQKKCVRITFKEITKTAIERAMQSPRAIDAALVDAQRARQVLDRLIGYKVSPVLWPAVGPRTSAGRVQSIALRFICEKEKEIAAFIPVDYWNVDAIYSTDTAGTDFQARVITEDKDNRFLTESDAEEALVDVRKGPHIISKVEREAKERRPNPPFDTTSLQSTCSSLFGWPATRTMQVAQHIYEAGKCFLPGVYVTKEDGSIVPIEDCISEVGIQSFDMKNYSSKISKCQPVKLMHHGNVIKLAIRNHLYSVTPDHLFPVFNYDTGEITDKKAEEIIPLKDFLIIDKGQTTKNKLVKYNIINVFSDDRKTAKKIRVRLNPHFFDNIPFDVLKKIVISDMGFSKHTLAKYRTHKILPLAVILSLMDKKIVSEADVEKHYQTISTASAGAKHIKMPFWFDTDFFYLIGLVLSDGHMSTSKILLGALLQKNPRKLPIGDYVNIEESINALMVKFGLPYSKNLNYSSSILKLYLERFDVPSGNKSRIIDIPKNVLIGNNNKYIAAFLAGLWDGDGYFTYSGQKAKQIQAGYTSASEKFINKLKILLARTGVDGNVHSDKRSKIGTIKISTYDIDKLYQMIRPFSLIKARVYEQLKPHTKTIKEEKFLPIINVVLDEIKKNGLNRNFFLKNGIADLWNYSRILKDRNRAPYLSLSKIKIINAKLRSKRIDQLERFNYEQVLTKEVLFYNGPVYCFHSENGYFKVDEGLITHNCSYIRTDSYNISSEAITDARAHIGAKFGANYLPSKPAVYHKKSSAAAQEAHEAIRPTHSDDEGIDLEGDDLKMYRLIRGRFLACQMTPMIVDTLAYTVKSGNRSLTARGQAARFDGWSKAYPYGVVEDKILPDLIEGQKIVLKEAGTTKSATKPPKRYGDGSLIEKMEADGVGRPATRASILKGIQDKKYVDRERGKSGSFIATDLGMRIYEYLMPRFNDFFMDEKFTAGLEEDIDKVAEGGRTYLDVVGSVYGVLTEKIKTAKEMKIQDLKTEGKCSVCGADIVEKSSRFGKYFACASYPECKTVYVKNDDGTFKVKVKKVLVSVGKCPECKKDLVERITKKEGKPFVACSGFPKCKYIQKDEGNLGATYIEGKNCTCGGRLVVRKAKKSGREFCGCEKFPKCRKVYTTSGELIERS